MTNLLPDKYRKRFEKHKEYRRTGKMFGNDYEILETDKGDIGIYDHSNNKYYNFVDGLRKELK